MNLYFMRHGVALERDPLRFPNDALRPLTLKGEERVRRCADAFRALDLSFDVIFTSPLVRARQTAEIVAGGLGLRRQLRFCEALEPDADLKLLFRAINRVTPRPKDVLLVGHEPDLSRTMALLISGQPEVGIEMKKNSVAKLEVSGRMRRGRCAALVWLLAPRQLGLLA